jgi:hypothetical protein
MLTSFLLWMQRQRTHGLPDGDTVIRANRP